MYLTASPTVLSFGSSSSGILTPNFSSAAIATSTIDSESTSRSSTKLFSSLTSAGDTSATSSRMLASPSRISSALATGVIPFGWWMGLNVNLRREHELPGIGQAGAEPEQQHGSAGRDLAALDHAGHGERDRG